MPRELTETERQDYLAAKHVAVLSVATADGRPPASIPIWYQYAPGGNILISTGPSSRKARLIAQAGAVTLVVQDEEPPYRYVVVEGTLVDTADPTPPEVLEETAVRYLGEEGGRQFIKSMEGHANVLFTFRPDRWLTADFSDEL
ncbi:pyridoxamine 5'-phosphate oxidase family protein [Mycolicibacterium sp. P1-5]|uniref:pyridoxamine 5'-phosphate oxidase family protein n=1 Tax=Mycolicibacterium sp. P1-5 TaxID=2024617 RepID=UPI0011EFF348|nr:pyridoxamine 5'-phosphate oxidase family protein [Mycolicibacterium sp. P1-5]KAA0108319.1 pyridoxamine 5-phosphate oxidase [Mycolicibacterium sp. P1-5]